MPKLNFENEAESYYALNLKRIQKEYRKYAKRSKINNVIIEEIIEVGKSIDLWNSEITKSKGKTKNKSVNSADIPNGIFQVEGVLSDFFELESSLGIRKRLSPEQWIEELEIYIADKGTWPSSNAKYRNQQAKTGTKKSGNIYNWLYVTIHYLPNPSECLLTQEYPELKDKLDKLYEPFRPLTAKEWVDEIEEYINQTGKWPTSNGLYKDKKIGRKSSKQMYKWLQGTIHYLPNPSECLLTQKYPELKDRLDELYEPFRPLTLEEWVDEIKEYINQTGKWPNKESKPESKEGERTLRIIPATMAAWLYNTIHYLPNPSECTLIQEYPELKAKLDKLYEPFRPLTLEEWVDEIEKYVIEIKRWPTSNGLYKDKKIGRKSSRQMYKWLQETIKYIPDSSKCTLLDKELKNRLDKSKAFAESYKQKRISEYEGAQLDFESVFRRVESNQQVQQLNGGKKS